METLFPGLVTLLVVSAPIAILIGFIYLGRRNRRSRGQRNPLTRSLLRSPGSSLRKALEVSQDEMMSIVILVSIASNMAAGFYWGRTLGDREVGITFWVLMAACVGIAIGFAVWKLLTLQRKIYRQRLGLDGEMAVGEELNQLMSRGYRIFHDIPGPNYNVDHVVIGPNGVFAVETKSHPKSAGGFTAECDGSVIRYPDRVETKATQQALRQAGSVAKYLSSACGNPVKVRGVVILPGWNVKQTKPVRQCVVMASGQIAREFPRLKSEMLTDGQIQAISHQIEQLCRSESPMSLSEQDDIRFAQRTTL